MAKLAIRGHATRGKEVIEILEMLGGKTSYECSYKDGFDSSYFFFINTDENFSIDGLAYNNEELKNYYIFTLEEFLEKYPYKVGDKVYNIVHNENQTITSVAWDCKENEVVYQTDNNECVYVNYLQPYKEETMEETDTINHTTEINLNHPCFGKCNEIELIIPAGWEFEQRGNKMFGVRKQQYPKTYEECCNVLEFESDRQTVTGYDAELIENFQKLKLFRDAYWKIYGEEMGLGKPWEPDWDDENEFKYGVYHFRNEIMYDGSCINPTLLTFPTREMRDTFYENFKNEIEQCKELL